MNGGVLAADDQEQTSQPYLTCDQRHYLVLVEYAVFSRNWTLLDDLIMLGLPVPASFRPLLAQAQLRSWIEIGDHTNAEGLAAILESLKPYRNNEMYDEVVKSCVIQSVLSCIDGKEVDKISTFIDEYEEYLDEDLIQNIQQLARLNRRPSRRMRHANKAQLEALKASWEETLVGIDEFSDSLIQQYGQSESLMERLARIAEKCQLQDAYSLLKRVCTRYEIQLLQTPDFARKTDGEIEEIDSVDDIEEDTVSEDDSSVQQPSSPPAKISPKPARRKRTPRKSTPTRRRGTLIQPEDQGEVVSGDVFERTTIESRAEEDRKIRERMKSVVPAEPKTKRRRRSSGTRKRRRWSAEEEQNLIEGVNQFGIGQWKKILSHFEFEGRTTVNLKDKYRNLVKYKKI